MILLTNDQNISIIMGQSKLSKLQKMILLELQVPQPRYAISQKVSKQLPNKRHQWKIDTDKYGRYMQRRMYKIERNQQTNAFKSAFSRSLKRLKQRGLIEETHNYHGRYYANLRLTDDGYEIVHLLNQ